MPADCEIVNSINSRFGHEHRAINFPSIIEARAELATDDYVLSVMASHPKALLYFSFEHPASKELVAQIMPDCRDIIISSGDLRAVLLYNHHRFPAAVVIKATDTLAIMSRRVQTLMDPTTICAICRETLIEAACPDHRGGTRILQATPNFFARSIMFPVY